MSVQNSRSVRLVKLGIFLFDLYIEVKGFFFICLPQRLVCWRNSSTGHRYTTEIFLQGVENYKTEFTSSFPRSFTSANCYLVKFVLTS